MIVRLLVLVIAAIVAVVVIKAVFVVAILALAAGAAWYALRFVRAFVLAPVRRRPVRPLVRPNISVRR